MFTKNNRNTLYENLMILCSLRTRNDNTRIKLSGHYNAPEHELIKKGKTCPKAVRTAQTCPDSFPREDPPRDETTALLRFSLALLLVSTV